VIEPWTAIVGGVAGLIGGISGMFLARHFAGRAPMSKEQAKEMADRRRKELAEQPKE
jgi:hypothetical protein